jgi:hypothetical protein
VVFSQFFWPAALQQLTGVLADGTWVPMAAVHSAAVIGALLAAWMAATAKRWLLNAGLQIELARPISRSLTSTWRPTKETH